MSYKWMVIYIRSDAQGFRYRKCELVVAAKDGGLGHSSETLACLGTSLVLTSSFCNVGNTYSPPRDH